MRVLIDECLPRALTRLLADHDCQTVREVGWSGRKNGELPALAEKQFDVLITIDEAMPSQQDVTGRPIALLVLSAPSNQIEDLASLAPAMRVVLRTIKSGTVMRVGE